MISKLTINGFPARLEEPFTWTSHWGPNHRKTPFVMDKRDAKKLLDSICGQRVGISSVPSGTSKIATRARPIQGDGAAAANGEITLCFQNSKGKKFKFKRLALAGEAAPKSPFHSIVLLSDRRFYWYDNEISFNINERRVSGRRRVISPPGRPIQVAQIADDITFAKLSMNPITGKPWTALEVLREVFNRVVGQEGVDWVLNFQPQNTALVQDFIIGSDGASAVAKALSLIPGADVWQNPEGLIVIDTRFPGHADKDILSLGPPLFVGQDIKKIDNRLKRNVEFHSLFEREIGFRFDFFEEEGADRDKNHPWIAPVLKMTDPSLTLTNGDLAIMGEFHEEELTLASWNANIAATGAAPVKRIVNAHPLNLANVNKFFIANLNRTYTLLGAVADAHDEVVGRYIAEIKRGHRQQFILNPTFVDACLRIELKNPGFIDPENGAESDSPVFADYSVLPTKKALSKNANAIQNMAFNFFGGVAPFESKGTVNTQSGLNFELADAKQAPAKASWISQALGIFRIDFEKDFAGFDARVLPSAITNAEIPSGNYFANIKDFNFASLTPTHKMNIIVALVPRVPNNDTRLHRVVVTPGDLILKYGIDVSGGCKSPHEDRIPVGLITAQYPYDEDKHEAVKRTLGIAVPNPNAGQQPQQLGDPINQDDLEELASAQALAHFLPLVDHYAGTKTVPMRNDIQMRSEIDSINYTFTKKGALLTTVNCSTPLDSSSIDPLGLIPQSAQRTLQRAVNIAGA